MSERHQSERVPAAVPDSSAPLVVLRSARLDPDQNAAVFHLELGPHPVEVVLGLAHIGNMGLVEHLVIPPQLESHAILHRLCELARQLDRGTTLDLPLDLTEETLEAAFASAFLIGDRGTGPGRTPVLISRTVRTSSTNEVVVMYTLGDQTCCAEVIHCAHHPRFRFTGGTHPWFLKSVEQRAVISSLLTWAQEAVDDG